MRKGQIKGNKKLKNTIFIFCEGETEECYFEVLKMLKRHDNVNIKTEKLGQVDTKSNKNINKILGTINQKYNISKGDLKKYRIKIYVLLDADVYKKNEITEMKNLFEKSGINLLFSNKNFELFILLHLENYTGTGDNYIKLIQKYYKDYEKGYNKQNEEIFGEIINNKLEDLKKSIELLEKIHKQNGYTHIKDKLPFSEVYEIYRDI